jgi:hypothetical protein
MARQIKALKRRIAYVLLGAITIAAVWISGQVVSGICHLNAHSTWREMELRGVVDEEALAAYARDLPQHGSATIPLHLVGDLRRRSQHDLDGGVDPGHSSGCRGGVERQRREFRKQMLTVGCADESGAVRSGVLISWTGKEQGVCECLMKRKIVLCPDARFC